MDGKIIHGTEVCPRAKKKNRKAVSFKSALRRFYSLFIHSVLSQPSDSKNDPG